MFCNCNAEPVAVEMSAMKAWDIWKGVRDGQDYSGFACRMASETNTSCGGRCHSEASVVSCPWPGLPTPGTEDGRKMMSDMNLQAVLQELNSVGVDPWPVLYILLVASSTIVLEPTISTGRICHAS